MSISVHDEQEPQTTHSAINMPDPDEKIDKIPLVHLDWDMCDIGLDAGTVTLSKNGVMGTGFSSVVRSATVVYCSPGKDVQKTHNVAVKIQRIKCDRLSKSQAPQPKYTNASFRRELVVFKKLSGFSGVCNHIPTFYGNFTMGSRHCIVMERMSCRVGEWLLRPFVEMHDVVDLALDFCLAVQWLHDKYNIVHNDIKPDNFMVNDRGYGNLIDFGFCSLEYNKGTYKTFRGSVKYAAPERLAERPHGKPSDIFSLGITLYECLTQQKATFPPGCKNYRPNTKTPPACMKLPHVDNDLMWGDVPLDLRYIVHSCAVREPRDRPTISVLVEIFTRERDALGEKAPLGHDDMDVCDHEIQ